MAPLANLTKPHSSAASNWRPFSALRQARLSVSGKLMAVILVTTATALLVAGTSLLTADVFHDRRSWGGDLATAASILARATAPALAFADREAANRNLAALAARPSIRTAALYDAQGHLYSSYVRPGGSRASAVLPPLGPGLHFHGGRAEVVQPIVQNNEWLGTVYLSADYDILGRIKAYASILALVMLAGLAAALVAAAWLQRRITQPLSSMANVARHIVEGREYTLRASKTTDDEFGLLVDAFNRMLTEIQQRTERILESNAALQEAIEVRRAAEQALSEADRRKDEFLATLAHELRNPLAPIHNAVAILDSPNADQSQRRWGRQIISRQVRHMSLLLDDLLDVSRITRGKLELKKEFVDLKAVCDVALEAAHPLIVSKQHTLAVDLPPTPLTLEVDPLRLAQVISNLLTNAAKYTDRNGRLKLTATVSEAGLVLSVLDNGIGLSPESIPRLFAIFSQVDTGIDRAQGGLGIGLSLVKGLVELHGGTVEVHSKGLGLGSEFIVRLPAATVSAKSANPTLPFQIGAGGETRPQATVLVVDDNRDAADSLSLGLGLRGFTAATAYSAAQALELAARAQPQALILDIGMPGMNGYEAAKRMRQEPWGRHVVLIALTGWGQEKDRLSAKQAGFDEHLTKPADVDTLEKVLAELLLAQRTAAETRRQLPVRA